MTYFLIPLAVAIAVIVVIFLQKRKAQQDAQNVPAQNFTSVDIDFSEPGTSPASVNNFIIRTPGGSLARSCYDIPMLYQLCVDQAVAEDIADMEPGWPKLTPGDFQFFIVPADHYSEVDHGEGLGAPLLNIRVNMGTQANPNISTVSSAGTTVGRAQQGTSPMTGDVIGGYDMYPTPVIPIGLKDGAPDYSFPRSFRNACRYEGEHRVEFSVSAAVAKPYLFAGDQHPHRGRDIWADPLPEVPASA